MANSYNGWPADPNPDAIGIDTAFTAYGSTFPGGMKAGSVSIVFRYLIGRLSEIDPMRPNPDTGAPGYGNWGWSYRANVNNPSSLSCHASGTAIDWAAPWHPNGTSTGPNGGGGWTGDQYAQVMAVLDNELDGVISWLTGNDPMHFEIDGTPAQVDAVAATLGDVSPGPEWEDDTDMPLSDEALQQIRDVIRDEIGPGAIENPDASLNAGIGRRAKIDRAWEFEAVPGYRRGDQ